MGVARRAVLLTAVVFMCAVRAGVSNVVVVQYFKLSCVVSQASADTTSTRSCAELFSTEFDTHQTAVCTPERKNGMNGMNALSRGQMPRQHRVSSHPPAPPRADPLASKAGEKDGGRPRMDDAGARG